MWNKLFLEERSSLGLSFFRIACAFTVISHVIPSFFHMEDNYLSTAYKEFNTSFFPVYTVEWIMGSPDWLICFFVWIFCLFSFFFLIGFLCQISAILTTIASYYFYALNSFHVGTLSWDILLVTLFLMCLVPYHGDYFSVDCLRREGGGFRQRRPYFIQRLLQLQIGFTFFYTALWKIYPEGNWLDENPIYYLMHKPPAGVTKWFLLRDYLKTQPELCYWIGIGIIVTELMMIFLLFWRKTRISALYMGVFFHIVLILTLDVPATFFFLFPAQLLLFIDPDKLIRWIDEKQQFNRSATHRPRIIYDGNCGFCKASIKRIEIMDIFEKYLYTNFRQCEDLSQLHPALTKDDCERQIILIDTLNSLHGGFDVFRKICFSLPMMAPLFFVFYFPGMGFIGPVVYQWVARNRFRFFKKPS
ncbi:MAG: DCC1-like thiol-disulfide oxidoreductase family protein [Candidatus Omnitrophota bacterium]